MRRIYARRKYLEPAPTSAKNRHVDSQTASFGAKLPADHPKYRDVVAIPVMAAVDAMPKPYRALVHDFGYVDIYRAWKRGLSPETIRAKADSAGGVFVL